MPKLPRRWMLWTGAGLTIALVLPISVIAWRTYQVEVAVFFPERHPVSVRADELGIKGLHAVTIPAGAETLGAWYAPGSNGSTIVLCHGAGGDRSQLRAEAEALADHGFGTLMFDWPGHGESSGTVRWNEPERRSLSAVLDWLVRRAEVDPQRIGALAFSLGGYIASQVAAKDPRIKALILNGTPSNLNDQVRLAHQRFRVISEPVARFALRHGGIDWSGPQPQDVIARFAPRPLLIVAGTDDVTVPLELSQALLSAAHAPKALHVVLGGTHGGYPAGTEQAYVTRVVQYFSSALGHEG